MESSYDSLESIANALGKPKRTQNGFDALCPCHSDTKPSMSLSKENGKLLWKCQKGCSQDDVGNRLREMGLWRPGLANNRKQPSAKKLVAVYSYHDENSKLLFQQCRFQAPDGGKYFRSRRPDSNHGWIYNLDGVERVLYRLPEIRSAIARFPSETILVVKGEKDCDNLVALGSVATTNPGGAGKWREDYTRLLSGAIQVVVVPDNDEPGRKHGNKVAKSLYSAGIPVRILNLPNLAPKGDVSDWLELGGTKEQLEALCEEAPDFQPSELNQQTSSSTYSASSQNPEAAQKDWHDPDSWSSPIFFGDEVTPEIVPDGFPPWLRDYILAVAGFTQTPPSMATMLALAVIAACAQRSFEISSDENDFREPLSVWVLAIMPPASRKSAVIAHLTKPLSEWEKKKGEELRPVIERTNAEREILKQQIASLKKGM